MIKGMDPQSSRFLADLGRIQARQEKVQRSISSGLRVGRSSDAPERVMDILQLRSEVERAGAIGVNLDRATAEVNTAEASMRVAVQLVERARVLAAQGGSDTAVNRAAMAVEARELHEQLVNLTRTTSEGRLVFSGDNDQQLLYRVDWSQPGGFVRNALANNTRQLEDVTGSYFSISRSAHQVFDVRKPDDSMADENAFNAVYSLATALEADDPVAVETAAGRLASALDHLGRQTTFYGHAQNRVRDAIDLGKKSMIARQQELGLAQDTDIAEALVELNMAKVHHEAALGAQARAPRTSLFDYLA